MLALLILTEARRAARTGSAGELIALDEQDRSLWDRRLIADGISLLSAALPRGAVGPYQIQAAVAAVHDEAPRAEDSDWPEILGLYALLLRMDENPMTALSHAIATAMVHGVAAGLERIDALAEDRRLPAHRSGASAFAGAFRRREGGAHELRARGSARDEHRRTELPDHARGASQITDRLVIVRGATPSRCTMPHG